MRIYTLILLFLAFAINLKAANSSDSKQLQIQYGSYMYVYGSQYIFIEISPKEVAPESGFTVLYITEKSEYNGELKMSKDNKSGQFKIGLAEYTVTSEEKESENYVHLEMKNSSDFDYDKFDLKTMNVFSEYRNGTFKNENEYGDRMMQIEGNSSNHKLEFRSWFSVYFYGGEDSASNYIAIPSDVKNKFYLLNENHFSIYELTYNEKDRNYTFEFKGNSQIYNFDAAPENEIKQQNDGTFFFEAMVAGKCEVKTSNEFINLNIEFDSEIRKDIKVISIKCHLDGADVIVDECTGISKNEITIFLANGVFELKGIQKLPFYIDTKNSMEESR